MKTIKINSLKLTNFKGIRLLDLKELSQETSIYGHNGTGKTTIFDAFTFLMFGKDSSDRKDFEIKTLDKNNVVIPQIDHEVEAQIEVNGEPITLRRILREKWVTKRGSIESEFSGNETQYEWNGVPMNMSEFNSKINTIVDEKVFKMITNPAAFNSLKWQDQRDVLIGIANVTDQDVIAGHADFQELFKNITQGNTLDEHKKQIKASMTKSKNEIKTIPTRIDEVQRSKPDASNFPVLRKQLEEKENTLKNINDQISDQLKAQQTLIDQKSSIRTQIQELDFKISDITHGYKTQARDEFRKQNTGDSDIKRQIVEKQSQITSSDNALVTLNFKLKSKNEELKTLSFDIVNLRKQWEEVNAKPMTFDLDTCCPTCKQDLPADSVSSKREELEKNMLDQKKKDLDTINAKGKLLKETTEATTKEKTDLETRIENGKSHIENLKKELEALQGQVSNENTVVESEEDIYNTLISKDTNIQPLKEEIKRLTEKMEGIQGVNVDHLKESRDTVTSEISAIKSSLHQEETIKKADERIEALSKEEKTLAQAIADIERQLFTIEAFEKEKSTRIEDSVNQRFQFVNFKLFETQINGGEVPTCKALINGVPFSDANTASKINAGLDIINTLCLHYKAIAPIFIDNRESVVKLIHTDSQIINLIVSEADTKLRVESGVMAEAI